MGLFKRKNPVIVNEVTHCPPPTLMSRQAEQYYKMERIETLETIRDMMIDWLSSETIPFRFGSQSKTCYVESGKNLDTMTFCAASGRYYKLSLITQVTNYETRGYEVKPLFIGPSLDNGVADADNSQILADLLDLQSLVERFRGEEYV